MTNETLTQIDPTQAERILGVRLPMSGSMEHEHKYRKKQIQSLATQVSNSPFQPHDAQMVYQSRYKAMIQYPLPLTKFTVNQLHTIQKPIVCQLLPKMGMNRNMSREVVYGPRSYGGREIMDLRLEQPILHLKTTVSHMRRGKNVGKALQITLNDVQAEIGTSKPFYNLDPNLYKYGDQHSWWRYTWKVNHSMDLNMEVSNIWCPKSKFNADKNIMEVAVQDAQFQGKTKWKLKIINHCRMFLQIFFISEMMDKNGKVSMKWLNGDKNE